MVELARRLGEMLAETPASDVPAGAMDCAALVVASTLASAAAGTGIESARIVRSMAREQGGRRDAHIWFDAGPALPLAEAARVNALTSDAAASDDSDLRAIVHAGTPLTAVALAAGERDGLSGEEVLAAIALGYEVSGRIHGAMTPGFKDRGFHGSVGAGLAAVAGAARALRLDADAAAHAIALAASSIGGIAIAADTSTSREWHAGAVVHAGATAALAAQSGFKGETGMLEARRGFFESFGGVDGAAAAADALRDPDGGWQIERHMAVKLVPGGHPYHAIAEAAARASAEADIAPEDIAWIEISRPGMSALHGPKHPADLIDMAHSPAYFAAAAAADQRFGWEHAQTHKIADPTIHALIDKVIVAAPPADAAPFRQGAAVSILAADGRRWSATVHLPTGSAALGIDWADIDAKFRALMPASGMGDQAIEAALARIRDLRGLDDVSRLVGLIRP